MPKVTSRTAATSSHWPQLDLDLPGGGGAGAEAACQPHIKTSVSEHLEKGLGWSWHRRLSIAALSADMQHLLACRGLAHLASLINQLIAQTAQAHEPLLLAWLSSLLHHDVLHRTSWPVSHKKVSVSHHTTPHHITSHHITSHHITSQACELHLGWGAGAAGAGQKLPLHAAVIRAHEAVGTLQPSPEVAGGAWGGRRTWGWWGIVPKHAVAGDGQCAIPAKGMPAFLFQRWYECL